MSKRDIRIKYVPHGINEQMFYPITELHAEYEKVEALKKQLFGTDIPEFVILYNARNIRRKCVPDLIAAYSLFCDNIGKDKAAKCALVLHTQPVDENGTDLPAVVDLLCNPEYQRVYFSTARYSTPEMNVLYGISDVVALISSNEGWGLSLTEGMMCGKPIIATVTGGMQDQFKFLNKEGKWITFDENFCSNHFGTYKKHGGWGWPVFPSNMSLVGSVATPYIWDDRVDFRDVAVAIKEAYETSADKRLEMGVKARRWVTSDEAMMSARWMCKNVIDTVEQTLETFIPKAKHEFTKIKKLEKKKLVHKLIY